MGVLRLFVVVYLVRSKDGTLDYKRHKVNMNEKWFFFVLNEIFLLAAKILRSEHIFVF